MPEQKPAEPEAPLALRALFYAADLLERNEATAFELLLGENQEVRDALARAASYLYGGGGAEPVRPDPAYRQRVLQKMPRPSLLAWLFSRRSYRGHPLLWCAASAAAAVVGVLTFLSPPAEEAVPGPGPLPLVKQIKPAEAPALDPEEASTAEALIWAEFPQAEHLLRVHEEETKRKNRTPVRVILSETPTMEN